MPKPPRLEDVPLSERAQKGYPKVEPGIINLVKAIGAAGFHTTGSCEGHMDYLFMEMNQHYPWINLFTRPRFREIIQEYNHQVDIRWGMNDENWDGVQAIYPLSEAISLSGILELQEEANKLACYIFENHVDDNAYKKYLRLHVY